MEITYGEQGIVRPAGDGGAEVHLTPDFPFDAQTQYHYQLTAIGEAMPNLRVVRGLVAGNDGHGPSFMIAGANPNGMVSWSVTVKVDSADCYTTLKELDTTVGLLLAEAAEARGATLVSVDAHAVLPGDVGDVKIRASFGGDEPTRQDPPNEPPIPPNEADELTPVPAAIGDDPIDGFGQDF